MTTRTLTERQTTVLSGFTGRAKTLKEPDWRLAALRLTKNKAAFDYILKNGVRLNSRVTN